MEFVEPEAGAADEKRFYFSPFVIEHIAVPVGMKAFAHIGIFVGIGPVEHKQAMRIVREMRRHPVEYNANACFMKSIDEFHNTLRIAKAAGRRKITGSLV